MFPDLGIPNAGPHSVLSIEASWTHCGVNSVSGPTRHTTFGRLVRFECKFVSKYSFGSSQPLPPPRNQPRQRPQLKVVCLMIAMFRLSSVVRSRKGSQRSRTRDFLWEVWGSCSGDYEEKDLISGFLLGLLVDPEDGGDTFLRNVSELHCVTTQKRLSAV
jgi:hypothetical protein